MDITTFVVWIPLLQHGHIAFYIRGNKRILQLYIQGYNFQIWDVKVYKCIPLEMDSTPVAGSYPSILGEIGGYYISIFRNITSKYGMQKCINVFPWKWIPLLQRGLIAFYIRGNKLILYLYIQGYNFQIWDVKVYKCIPLEMDATTAAWSYSLLYQGYNFQIQDVKVYKCILLEMDSTPAAWSYSLLYQGK